MQQGGLLAQGHGMDGGQHADRRADPDAPGAAQQQRGEGDRRRAGAVRHEVVLGQPDRVQPGLLGHFRGPYRPVERLPLALAGELGAQYKCSYVHRSSCFLGSESGAPPPA